MRGMLLRSLAIALALAPGAASADPPNREAAVREADSAARTADLAGQRLLRVLDEVRLGGERQRVTCVDGKLSQVNSHTRMILERRERLRAAAQRGDDGAVAHERLVIRNLVRNLARLEREGRSCVHPEAGASGDTVVITIVDPEEVPDEDPSLWVEAEHHRWRR
ncbi:MAG: hypothetical protein M5U28_36970 [Sandaracinaceae bacterium]|nr:hypothetical protein [Sandaracinaceae bacterium]